MRDRRLLRSGLLVLALALAAAPTRGRAEDESVAYEGVVGVSAALCTLIYSPLKVVYATSGIVVSGLSWLWSMGDTEASAAIYRSSLGGDYVVTREHLEGRRELSFTGRS